VNVQKMVVVLVVLAVVVGFGVSLNMVQAKSCTGIGLHNCEPKPPSFYTVLSSIDPVAPGQFVAAEATCNEGDLVVGGGFSHDSSNTTTPLTIISSAPTAVGGIDTWRSIAFNPHAVTEHLISWARCAR